MTNTKVTFRARARTIDHLGKGQIADCPTAVSELWKNAYDAYARNVALHAFNSNTKCAAIIDDGCGMSMQQLVDSWLVVGTNAKSTKKLLPEADRFGLPPRQTQGEKGIGRLSSAFLAPVTFLITKKIDTGFSAALIDWRLFENTYLSLSDVDVPIAEFEEIEETPHVFRGMLSRLKDNLCQASRADLSLERHAEIKAAWDQFDADQLEHNRKHNLKLETTSARISRFCDTFQLPQNLLTTWASLLSASATRDTAKHGTALYLLDVDRDLSLLTDPGAFGKDNFEVVRIQQDLIDTLRAFVDPFSSDTLNFQYEIKIFSDDQEERTLLRQTDVFNLEDFLNLEHVVQGTVDSRGWFRGRVKAFGIDMGEVKFAPHIEMEQQISKVGPFSINLGTFENEADKSSHTDTDFARLSQQTNKYTGLMIFRDGLRVLPYGRSDNDFFEIEERRSKNAGRYYWARRRIFGQILITQSENSLLKDKAGREGFIKNQAARELRALVENILTALADRFFGKKSDARKDILAVVKKERDARKDAQTKARSQTQRSFISDLKKQEPELAVQLDKIKRTYDELMELDSPTLETVVRLDDAVQKFETIRTGLRTPVKPPKLGDHEERYRSYRDMYNEFVAHIVEVRNRLNHFEADLSKHSPTQSAKRHFERNQALLNSQVNRSLATINSKISKLNELWTTEARADRGNYYQQGLELVEAVNENNLTPSLNGLDSIYNELSDDFTVKYEALIRALERLENGINLDAAFSMAEEERSYYENKARSLQSLAQLGISVEILAHELEELDGAVSAGLNSLPSDIKKNHPGFRHAFDAHKSLTQQIRFLSPLKLSGYQARRDITGLEIREHIISFFGDRFSRQRVQVDFGELFTRIVFKDLPSRIYPVFINITNNALYWVSLVQERRIQFDVIDGEVIIANSGPPVDEDDIPRLFELFYTKRSNGHGVGLYLCKENLGVAHHKIRYGGVGDVQLIEGGANFIITFSGLEFAA